MSEAPALLQRLRCTPWSDLLKFKLTGRHDWRSMIEQSQLPEDCQQLLVDVLRDAKLTRAERASVASELIAHFEDGNQRGNDWVALKRNFGDPTMIAELIQRSKERSRSMLGKILKPLGLASGAGVVAFAIWAYFFMNREANPSVDYTKELNVKALASAESDRAWPIYRDTWIKHEFVSLNLHSELAESAEGEILSVNPGHKAWPQVVKLLDEHRDLLDALREGSSKPALGLELKNSMEAYADKDQQALFPHWYANKPEFSKRSNMSEKERLKESSVIAVLLPHVQAFRTASYLLIMDARRAVAKDDVDSAIDNIRVNFGMAKHAAEPSCFVAALVGFAVADSGYTIINELLNNKDVELTEEQLEKIHQLVAELNVHSFIDTKTEQYMVYDILQRTYTDDGDGHGRITKDGLGIMSGLFPEMREANLGFSLTWKFLNSDRKEMSDVFDTFYEQFRDDLFLTWHEQPRTVDDLVGTTFKADSPASYFAQTFISGLDAIRDTYHRQVSTKRAVEAVVALHQYKQKNGKFPGRLGDLVPDYLNEVARDPLTDRPMSYVLDDKGQPKLYFWGHDGVDDRGAVLDGGPGHQVKGAFGHSAKDCKGDWVLWPLQK